MTLTREQSLLLRGTCIISICLHNLLHLKSKVYECEFVFNNARVENLFSHTPTNAWDVFDYIFSFWGWYGVCIFMFLSGYGLVMKYEVKGQSLSPLIYILRNYLKLFLLMVIPLTTMYAGHIFSIEALEHLTFTINLIDPGNITPGVYWYFGLTFQFYLLYLIFYYKRGEYWLYAASMLSIVLVFYFEVREPLSLYYSRHNSIGWLMVFLFGVWYARGGHENRIINVIFSHRIASIGLFGALWLYSSINSYIWVISPFFFILACLLLVQKKSVPRSSQEGEQAQTLLGRACHYTGRGAIYLGVISAGIFAWHPVFRVYSYLAMDKGFDLRLITPIYLIVSILVAAFFTPLYKKMTKWTFKVLHLK